MPCELPPSHACPGTRFACRRVADAGGAGEGGAGDLSEAHLGALEDAIRDAVRSRRSVYEGSKDLLLRLFKWVARLAWCCRPAIDAEGWRA